jgi:hypothetical protein
MAPRSASSPSHPSVFEDVEGVGSFVICTAVPPKTSVEIISPNIIPLVALGNKWFLFPVNTAAAMAPVSIEETAAASAVESVLVSPFEERRLLAVEGIDCCYPVCQSSLGKYAVNITNTLTSSASKQPDVETIAPELDMAFS